MTKIILNEAVKKDTFDQDKIISPGETVRRFKDKLKNIDMDILEETVRIDNGRLDIPVYFSNCGSDAQAVIGNKKQMGKGGTPQQAEASAVMELAERFSFFSFYQNPDNFIQDQYKNIRNQAIDFDQIIQSVHDTSQDTDQAAKIFENLDLRWAQGYNLTKNKEVLIPFDWFFTINQFNGACAGNCNEEALSQGICEVVERHVSSLVSQNNLDVPLIDPESVTDPLCLEMLEKYKKAGIKLWISDFTLNTGIPTIGVLAYDPSTFPHKSEIVWTAGTTPNPQKALSRALSETAQLGGDFNSGSNYVASGLPKFSDIKQAEFITSAGRKNPITSLPDLSDNNIKTEVQNLISILAQKNMDVFAVNTTHPVLEIPCFYIIIPGAHFRERAENSSAGMFCTKLIKENNPAGLAILELKKAEKLLPDKYYIQFYLGTSYLDLNDPDTALEHLKKALELDPAPQDIPSIYSYMGVCLRDLEKYQEALDLLEKGISMDSERTDIHNLMGFCYFKLKEHEKAIECFQDVLKINPGSAIDYANIASNYREMGWTEKAIAYYEMALGIDGSIDFARDSLERLKKKR
ncbi:YcaO-like domain-containing protein [Desulfonema limicola]|uniref:YcaO-like domain-containing protein n=1 Tax=Desulfonema limicola TaxID=45656 RepID=A0A975BAX4_9BACT|nr:YcaO-like family protein [Desulfonema limicola]QTA81982.1 YcaO-like domain-containing protein [Desulfonema limicola]